MQIRVLDLTCSQTEFSSKEWDFLFILFLSVLPSSPCGSSQVGGAVLGFPNSGHGRCTLALLIRARDYLVPLRLS